MTFLIFQTSCSWDPSTIPKQRFLNFFMKFVICFWSGQGGFSMKQKSLDYSLAFEDQNKRQTSRKILENSRLAVSKFVSGSHEYDKKLWNISRYCSPVRNQILLTRSAHRTPNFTNPKYFVCLLFEYFFQIKVLNSYQNTPKNAKRTIACF